MPQAEGESLPPQGSQRWEPPPQSLRASSPSGGAVSDPNLAP